MDSLEELESGLSSRKARFERRWVGGLLCLASLLGWMFLGLDSLLNSDDVLYAQMALETHLSFATDAMSGDRVFTLEHTWMGVTLYEKPPLLLWLLQLSGGLFGFTDAAMRLPAALGATFTLVYTYKITSEILPTHLRKPHVFKLQAWPLVACFTLISSATFLQAGGRVMTDTLLSAAVVACLYYVLKLWREPQRRWHVGLGLAAGLGFMAKSFAMGPTFLALGVFLLWKKRRKHLLMAVLVGVCVALPWHLFMTLRHGAEFWDVYLGYHVIERASGLSVGQEGFFFYLIELWKHDAMVPLLLLPALAGTLALGHRRQDHALLPLLLTTLLGLGVLHLSQTKFIHYFVPLLPLLSAMLVYAVSTLNLPAWGRVAFVAGLAVSLGMGMVRDVPDSYRPDLKAIAQRTILPAASDTRIIVVNEYAPSLFYYGQKKGEIMTDSPEFYDIQQSIDMMRRSGIVSMADESAFQSVASSYRPVILVAPHRRLKDSVGEDRANPQSRLLRHWATRLRRERPRDVEVFYRDGHFIVLYRVAFGGGEA